ncbi:MAG: electron transfer flavoprotein subunit alpha/FixB family protein [Polyangiaceae bacterium]|nr:electron transfer flavoprotein subunit alpha/FixB family protein [Polyangiaceae bacterium]
MKKVLVIAELDSGKVRKATYSSIAFARQVVGFAGGEYSILVVGQVSDCAVQVLAGYGAAQILVAEIGSVAGYVCEHYAPTVSEVAQGFDVVVATATSFGKDLIPRVAAKIGAGYAADICSVSEDGGLVYKRPMYAGNAFGYLRVTTPKHAVTVRQSEFAAAEPTGGASPVVAVSKQSPDSPANNSAADRVEYLGFERAVSGRPELTDASVIVAGGRACRDKFFDVLNPLADVFGAAIGATRAACDAGYAPGDLQVGQTGKIVAPRLYFAIGLSGAIQHLAGMKGSRVIVAVNKDPDAPIFSVADYGLVADLFSVVPELVERIRTVRD